jgi:hypothetical protein
VWIADNVGGRRYLSGGTVVVDSWVFRRAAVGVAKFSATFVLKILLRACLLEEEGSRLVELISV